MFFGRSNTNTNFDADFHPPLLESPDTIPTRPGPPIRTFGWHGPRTFPWARKALAILLPCALAIVVVSAINRQPKDYKDKIRRDYTDTQDALVTWFFNAQSDRMLWKNQLQDAVDRLAQVQLLDSKLREKDPSRYIVRSKHVHRNLGDIRTDARAFLRELTNYSLLEKNSLPEVYIPDYQLKQMVSRALLVANSSPENLPSEYRVKQMYIDWHHLNQARRRKRPK